MHFSTFTCSVPMMATLSLHRGGEEAKLKERMDDPSPHSSNYLLVPDVIRAGRGWFLHGDQAQHLQQMVLHDIPTCRKDHQGPSSGQNVLDARLLSWFSFLLLGGVEQHYVTNNNTLLFSTETSVFSLLFTDSC